MFHPPQCCPVVCQDYYARLTLNKAMNHVRAKGASASAGSRQPSASVEPPSGAQASGMAPAAPQYVTLSQVQQIVQDALQRQSASSSHSTKTCALAAFLQRHLYRHTLKPVYTIHGNRCSPLHVSRVLRPLLRSPMQGEQEQRPVFSHAVAAEGWRVSSMPTC